MYILSLYILVQHFISISSWTALKVQIYPFGWYGGTFFAQLLKSLVWHSLGSIQIKLFEYINDFISNITKRLLWIKNGFIEVFCLF